MNNRVLGRTGARELSFAETTKVSGATVCTFDPPTCSADVHGMMGGGIGSSDCEPKFDGC